MAPRWLFALLAAAALYACAAPAAQAKTPRCFGAAARDPLHPCENRSLRLTVTPNPRDAPLIPGSPCTKLNAQGLAVPRACGARAAGPQAQSALIGDSHAAHWRPPVTLIAERLHWRGVAMTR